MEKRERDSTARPVFAVALVCAQQVRTVGRRPSVDEGRLEEGLLEPDKAHERTADVLVLLASEGIDF